MADDEPAASVPVSGAGDVRRQRRAEGAARRRMRPADARTATGDSYQNFVASVGQGTNNTASYGQYGFNPISRRHIELEWLYRGSWIAQVAVDTVADDMMRSGLDLGSDLPPHDAEHLLRSMQLNGTWNKIRATNKWARLYGGAVAVMMIDGQDLKTPLQIETVAKGQFKGLVVMDRWMVNASVGELEEKPGDDLGMPKYYDVQVAVPGLGNSRVHHSRCLRIDGIELPYWQKVSENYWSLSVLEPLWDRLLAFDSTTLGAAQLVYKAYLRTWKVFGLRKILGGNQVAKDALLENAQWMRQFQNNEGISLIDSEDDFAALTYSFGGLSDVLQQFAQQLSGALQIPLVRLFGQSPAGFSSGDSDLRTYYDGVAHEQESRLRRPLDKLLRVHARSEGIKLPEGFWWTFKPLWLLDDVQKASVAGSVVTAVTGALENGAISPQIAAKELKQSSNITGVFSNITEEFIAGLDEDAPPVGEESSAFPGERPDENGQEQPPSLSGSQQGETPSGGQMAENDALGKPSASRHVHFHVVNDDDGRPRERELVLHGLPIYIETFKGQERRGLRGWSVKMPADYGYLRNTSSAEDRSEALDCYVGPARDSHEVFIIDQVHPETGAFDEHKCMLGYPNRQLALRDYQRAFSDGSGAARVGGVKHHSLAKFKEWLVSGDVTRGVA